MVFKKEGVNFLEKVYLFIVVIIFCLVVSTPYIIRSGFSFIREEYLEGALIAVLLSIGFFVVDLYRHELIKVSQRLSRLSQEKNNVEDKLEEAFRYIGAVNVQVSAIRSLFVELDRYPESKNEMKKVLKFLSDKVLSIAPVDWVILRVIDIERAKTLREIARARSSAIVIKHQINNQDLIDKRLAEDYEVVSSPPSNMSIRIFCIFPKVKLSDEQKIMLTAIVKQLEMLFIIFESKYYKHKSLK